MESKPEIFVPMREFEAFNGFKLIEAHRTTRTALENYVHGCSDAHELHDESCHPECLFGQWLHGDEPKIPEHLPLFDALCYYCESFHEILTQAVLLKQMGQDEGAKSLLEEGSNYRHTSGKFEHNIMILHDILKENHQNNT